ncbi:MAG TPA: hypothetical protein VMP03_16310, partial [Methylomirabilota bacterium]|nr:hypothetical protein [Methylomirabilota bacterium]
MSRARRRRRSGRGGDGWKIGLGLLAGVVAVGMLGGMVWLNATVDRPPVLNAETLCPVLEGGGAVAGARSVTVVLLDGSDALPAIAQEQVSKALGDLAASLPPYGLLEVRLLDVDRPGGRTLFARCNPGSGEGLSEWTANPEAARRRWIADFRDPVEAIIGGGVPAAPADISPIMAAIQTIAVQRFEGDRVRDAPKTLVIVSDMLEHTPDYSHYRDELDYAAFRARPVAARTATDLHGADVMLYYISREGAGPGDS